MSTRPATEQVLLTVTAVEGIGFAEPEAWITSSRLDRMKDRVRAEGAEVESFLRNPQVNYGHSVGRYDALPVATATSLRRVGDRWRMRWRWLENDPFADRVKNACNQGVLRATSIEFLPLASEPNAEGGRDFTRWELLGVALCPVPANPEAVRQCKALGLPVGSAGRAAGRDDEIILDIIEDDVIDVEARDVVEAVRVAVPQLVRAEWDRRREAEPIDLDAIDADFNPLTNVADREALLTALRATIPVMIRSAANRLRGRIDDGD